jgi:hypothetical protein
MMLRAKARLSLVAEVTEKLGQEAMRAEMMKS